MKKWIDKWLPYIVGAVVFVVGSILLTRIFDSWR
jgi:hypothetical protein